MGEELKPCPFCGGRARLCSRYVPALSVVACAVECTGCYCAVDFTEWDETGCGIAPGRDEVAEKWNRRANDE